VSGDHWKRLWRFLLVVSQKPQCFPSRYHTHKWIARITIIPMSIIYGGGQQKWWPLFWLPIDIPNLASVTHNHTTISLNLTQKKKRVRLAPVGSSKKWKFLDCEGSARKKLLFVSNPKGREPPGIANHAIPHLDQGLGFFFYNKSIIQRCFPYVKSYPPIPEEKTYGVICQYSFSLFGHV